ncbi:MAG: type II toxin-antitoxin system RelE/ParE family toxin [Acidobacteriota bacterium]
MDWQIRWSPRAATDLEEGCAFIAKDSEHYAAIFARRVVAIVEGIPFFPRAGRVVPEYRDENLREKLFGNYRIVYRLRENVAEHVVEIVTIHHAARPLDVTTDLT